MTVRSWKFDANKTKETKYDIHKADVRKLVRSKKSPTRKSFLRKVNRKVVEKSVLNLPKRVGEE